MKRMTLTAGCIALVALFGCAPKADQSAAQPEPPQEVASQAPDASEASASPTVLSMNYIEAATALAADDFERAKASLTALAGESTGELQTLARDCAGAADIAAMRESFKSLSTFATGMELPKDYAVAFCPMYQGGAKWVQKRDTLANPYFGKSMLTCGSFVN
jgi:hypothetical protein